jgi:hypothetical protein
VHPPARKDGGRHTHDKASTFSIDDTPLFRRDHHLSSAFALILLETEPVISSTSKGTIENSIIRGFLQEKNQAYYPTQNINTTSKPISNTEKVV